MAAYATVIELADYIQPTATPTGAARLLMLASLDVDRALLCAIYPVDDAGEPTEARHAEALRDATLEQVIVRMALGSNGTVRVGIPAGIGSVKIGTLQLTGPGQGGDMSAAVTAEVPLGSVPRAILQRAGLLGGDGPIVTG